MKPLSVYAGPKALDVIRKEGIHPGIFRYVLGASGGPKWFVLAGLDRVIFPEFFAGKRQNIDVIGSSAGAFRAACMVQQNPLAAINRLAENYSQTVYSKKPDSLEITQKARELINYVMGEDGVMDVITNRRRKVHIFVARCKGMMSGYGKFSQLPGLAMSAVLNSANRRNLRGLYERYVFSAPQSHLQFTDPYQLPTKHVELGYNNVKDALLASGAIPVVIDGVEHIIDAPSGMYRDGGIIDYHFDLAFGNDDGLVLYPHFYPKAIPGWFDKGLKKRVPHKRSYDNVVMLVPSAEFVATLPYSKIPDRKDFEVLDATSRIAYWQTVLKETDRLGDYFMQKVQSGELAQEVEPLPFVMQ